MDQSVIIAASAPPGGGRSNLTPRFTRFFNIFCMPTTSEDSLTLIFNSILKGFLEINKFKPEIQELAKGKSCVNATLNIYQSISKELLPTPQKSHYTFNLRDVSKIFQGLLLAKPNTVQTTETFVRMWVHETSRTFYDRLVNEADQKWFKDSIVRLLASTFKVEWNAEAVYQGSPVVFGDFMKRGVEMKLRQYEEIRDFAKLTKTINDYMQEETKINIVLF